MFSLVWGVRLTVEARWEAAWDRMTGHVRPITGTAGRLRKELHKHARRARTRNSLVVTRVDD